MNYAEAKSIAYDFARTGALPFVIDGRKEMTATKIYWRAMLRQAESERGMPAVLAFCAVVNYLDRIMGAMHSRVLNECVALSKIAMRVGQNRAIHAMRLATIRKKARDNAYKAFWHAVRENGASDELVRLYRRFHPVIQEEARRLAEIQMLTIQGAALMGAVKAPPPGSGKTCKEYRLPEITPEVRQGFLSRCLMVPDRMDEIAASVAANSVKPLVDVTEPFSLQNCGLQQTEIIVEADFAEYRGRVWIRDTGPDEDWVKIEGPDNARRLAAYLIAYADKAEGKA